MKVIDHVLKQYAPYNDYENEADKANRLKAMMHNAENFAVAQE